MGRDALSIRVAERRELTGEKGETEPTVVNAAVDDVVVSVVDGYLAYTVGRHRNTVAGPRLERDKFPAVEAVEAVPRRKPYKSVLVLENLSHMAVGEPIVLTINYGPVRLRNTYGCCGQTNDCYRHCPSHCVEFLCSLSVIVFAFYWLNFPFCAPTLLYKADAAVLAAAVLDVVRPVTNCIITSLPLQIASLPPATRMSAPANSIFAFCKRCRKTL